jgi:8-amino-3,8-dideoxy-alpha-D-manno-octulosonate transaminase
MGYRMDELRAAVLRVQLRKLPTVIAAMRASKYRLRSVVERFANIRLRTVSDPAGDTGCFLISTYQDGQTAAKVARALRAEGMSTGTIPMSEWGLHLYYNNVSLLRRASAERGGYPWTHPSNQAVETHYEKGSCPTADSLFERSVIAPIPSRMSAEDEQDMLRAFEKVLSACV